MAGCKRILFQDQEFILTEDGAIATREAYAAGEPSYAHLFPDGRIMRYQRVIGSESDIQVLGDSDADISTSSESLANLLFHPGWLRGGGDA